MILGLSFGKKKQTTDQTTAVNSTQTGFQDGTTSQTSAQSGTSSTTGSQTTSGSTTGSQTGATTGLSSTTGQQTTTGKASTFSDTILAALESATLGGLSKAGVVAGPRADSLAFDPTSFVEGGMRAATAGVQADLESGINSLFDSVGGTSGGNSMAALLANRMRGDASASLAGTRAKLEGEGQGIQQANIGVGLAQQGLAQQFVTQMLDMLKGGVTTTQGALSTAETTAQQQAQTQQQAQQTAQQTQSQEQSATTQLLASIINELVNSTQSTVGTENVKGTVKSSGGGASLSL